MNHVYLSEKLSLQYLKKKTSYPDSIPSFQWQSLVGVWGIRVAYFLPIRYKAPKMINMWDEQEVLSQEALDQNWKALREELWQEMERLYPRFATHMVFRHAIAGRMTMRQMIWFFRFHLLHHRKQILRKIEELTRNA